MLLYFKNNYIIIHAIFNKTCDFCPNSGFFLSQVYGNNNYIIFSLLAFYDNKCRYFKVGFFGDFLLPSNDNKKIPLILQKF